MCLARSGEFKYMCLCTSRFRCLLRVIYGAFRRLQWDLRLVGTTERETWTLNTWAGSCHSHLAQAPAFCNFPPTPSSLPQVQTLPPGRNAWTTWGIRINHDQRGLPRVWHQKADLNSMRNSVKIWFPSCLSSRGLQVHNHDFIVELRTPISGDWEYSRQCAIQLPSSTFTDTRKCRVHLYPHLQIQKLRRHDSLKLTHQSHGLFSPYLTDGRNEAEVPGKQGPHPSNFFARVPNTDKSKNLCLLGQQLC